VRRSSEQAATGTEQEQESMNPNALTSGLSPASPEVVVRPKSPPGAATGRAARLRSIAALAMGMMASAFVLAQPQPSELRAGTLVAPPFVMKQGDQLTGFSIDIWNEVAARLKVKTTFQEVSDVAALEDTLGDLERSKGIDVVVSAIYYTTERDRKYDLSLPIVEAGLQVMVRGGASSGESAPLRDMLALLSSRSAAVWLGAILLIILIPAHVMWLLDRGSKGSVSPDRGYFPGIFQSLLWATTALVSQVQHLPSRWPARVFGLLWMFAGVVFVALYTAQLTATLTAERIQGAINGPADLAGRSVATIEGSVAAAYLREIRARPVEVRTTDEMFAALLDKRVDAVFMNSSVLRYYAEHDGKGRVKVVGSEVKKGEFGFLFKLGSPLRRKVNSALVALREDGTYERLYAKWFGRE
jgi:polar amino acid transport system substrate-binding protein